MLEEKCEKYKNELGTLQRIIDESDGASKQKLAEQSHALSDVESHSRKLQLELDKSEGTIAALHDDVRQKEELLAQSDMSRRRLEERLRSTQSAQGETENHVKRLETIIADNEESVRQAEANLVQTQELQSRLTALENEVEEKRLENEGTLDSLFTRAQDLTRRHD